MAIRSISFWIAILLLWVNSAAQAQTLQFDAKVGSDGKIELVPRSAKFEKGVKVDPLLQQAPFTETSPGTVSNVYMWTNDAGAIKGIYTSQNEALKQGLAAGDTLKALAVTPEFASWTQPADDYLKSVAQEAARQLMQYARDSACAMDPKPDTITPTIEVSFSAVAGGSISVSATWSTATLCKKVP